MRMCHARPALLLIWACMAPGQQPWGTCAHACDAGVEAGARVSGACRGGTVGTNWCVHGCRGAGLAAFAGDDGLVVAIDLAQAGKGSACSVLAGKSHPGSAILRCASVCAGVLIGGERGS